MCPEIHKINKYTLGSLSICRMCSKASQIQIKKLQPNLLEEAKGKYVVAEFLPFQDVDDITVEAIPGYWLGESASPFIIPLPKNIIHTYMFAYIPANESVYRARKAKLENILPDTAKWIKWPLRFVLDTIFDTYQDARREEANAEAYPYSDLEGYKKTDTTVDVRRRVSKKKHWLGDTSSTSTIDDTDGSVSGEENCHIETTRVDRDPPSVASGIGVLPDPPSLFTQSVHHSQSRGNKNDINSMEHNLPGNIHDESVHLPEMYVIQSTLDRTLTAGESPGNLTTSETYSGFHEPLASTSTTSFRNSTIVRQDSMVSSDVPMQLNQELHTQDMDILHFLSGDKPDDFYKACLLRILHRTTEIENKVTILENRIENLIQQQTTQEQSKSEDEINDKERLAMEALVPLPVSTKEELQLLNTTLRTNSRYFTFLRLFMKDACPIPCLPNLDSKTIKQELHKAVGHIYSRIMTNELALQFNLFGRNNNGRQKEAFKQFQQLLAVTFEAIRPKAQIAKLQIDKAQTDGAVGEWLRQATNRLEEKKILKKRKIAERRSAEKATKQVL